MHTNRRTHKSLTSTVEVIVSVYISLCGESTEILMKNLMTLLKAIADENRVRLLLGLKGGELCVCQLIDFIDLAPSTVSKHMSILRNADLVSWRKEGRWVYYKLPEGSPDSASAQLLAWLIDHLEEATQIKDDLKKLQEVLEKIPACS